MSLATILNFSIFKKMLKVYRLSADDFGLSVQKSFRINGRKNYFILKEHGKSLSLSVYLTFGGMCSCKLLLLWRHGNVLIMVKLCHSLQ